MMKENAISKINKVGKVGYIISKILCILTIIGSVCCFIGSIACFALPKNLVNVKLGGAATVTTDISAFTEFSEKQKLEIAEELEEATSEGAFYINGSKYSLDSYEVYDDGLSLDCSANIKTIDMRDIAKVCLLVLLTCICSYVTLLFIKKLCRAFRDCQSPFEAEVIKRLQQVAYSLIPWVCISNFSQSIIYVIVGGNISITFNFGIIIAILMILGLSYIFKYGAILQTESDETL